MKTWIQPMAEVQLFVANEYVAACWSVACDVMGSNSIGTDPLQSQFPGQNLDHGKSACGSESSYRFTVVDGHATGMQEYSESQGMWLNCEITDSNWVVTNDFSTVQPGRTVYWITRERNQNDKLVWHHKGTVTANHS